MNGNLPVSTHVVNTIAPGRQMPRPVISLFLAVPAAGFLTALVVPLAVKGGQVLGEGQREVARAVGVYPFAREFTLTDFPEVTA